MIGFIKKSVGNKIMVAVTVSILLVMGVEITLRIYFGTRDRVKLVEALSTDLAASAYSGIKYPMSVGDSEAVERVLADVRLKMEGVEVFICDSDQKIIWSTHEQRTDTKVSDSITSVAPLLALNETLRSGVAPKTSLKEGEQYLITIQPIFNDEECYHCHGSSRKILGGMVIRTDVQLTMAAVAEARNRTVIIALLGLLAIIILIYTLVGKFIRHPLAKLADSAKKFAEGDRSVSMDVSTGDEIGVLSNTFNYMVRRISTFSKALELEVEEKTNLLNERTTLVALLKRANSQLRELDILKSRFLANMSHELRTPMNSVIGYTDLLLDEIDGPINEEQKKSLQKITVNARHLLNLINDILDLSRIESGKIELEPSEFDLQVLINSSVPVFEPMVSRKGLSLSIVCDEERFPTVYADRDKIRQVLVNLIGNAIKFTEEGGKITIHSRLSERGVKPGEKPIFVEVCVEDTGIGIKEEYIDKIFNKFVQADLSTIRQYEGTGLGLNIAKKLIALHKGMIWAVSEYGKGSQFCFTVPIRKEILEHPEKPVVELAMADALAEYYGLPVETFLRDPEYAGNRLRCREYIHCGEVGCPAYESDETRCWLILGTHCEGLKIAAYPEKTDFCKGCEVIKKLVLESSSITSDEATHTHIHQDKDEKAE